MKKIFISCLLLACSVIYAENLSPEHDHRQQSFNTLLGNITMVHLITTACNFKSTAMPSINPYTTIAECSSLLETYKEKVKQSSLSLRENLSFEEKKALLDTIGKAYGTIEENQEIRMLKSNACLVLLSPEELQQLPGCYSIHRIFDRSYASTNKTYMLDFFSELYPNYSI